MTKEKPQYQGPLCFRCGRRGNFTAQCFRPRIYEESNSQGDRGFNPPQYNTNVVIGQYANRNYYGRVVSPRGFGRGFDNNYRIKTMHAGIASNVLKLLTQLTQTCKIFTRLKRIHNQLRLSYEEKINESLGGLIY